MKWENLSKEDQYILHPDDIESANEYGERICSGQFPIEYSREQSVYHAAADYLAGIKQYKTSRNEIVLDAYEALKRLIGQLGFNNFISSKEVEEYRKWLREDKYKHRLEWFEKEYPNGLFYKDADGIEYGVNIITKQFLAEADEAK